jgi:hypothetical protein
MVCWEQSDVDIPIGGGHIVVEVLADAAKKCAGDLYVQACNPHCDYAFVHTSIRVREASYGDIDFKPDVEQPNVVFTPLTYGDDLDSVAEELFHEIALSVENFAELKNTTQRIKDIERAARHDLSNLLFIQYEHTKTSTKPSFRGYGSGGNIEVGESNHEALSLDCGYCCRILSS